MKEEIVRIISNDEASVIEEVSDSNSISHQSPASKRTRCGSAFKGVVPQHNGHWGCQIYANHQRIWLGTFKSEKDAAMAYDSAALKLRSGDLRRNFPLTNITSEEPNFQIYYSTEAVINMIKDGTYQSKLADFIKSRSQSVETELSSEHMKVKSHSRITCNQLFQKELTPSDVGKLNRLVIPKKFAMKFLPRVLESIEENETVNKGDDSQICFYDRSMKLWKFRYCYWKSSQSYVFTRGWNRFVKEKQLKANEIIVFSLCEYLENADQSTRQFYMIDVDHGENQDSQVEAAKTSKMEVQLQLHPGHRTVHDDAKTNMEAGLTGLKLTQGAQKGGLKLFGVRIV